MRAAPRRAPYVSALTQPRHDPAETVTMSTSTSSSQAGERDSLDASAEPASQLPSVRIGMLAGLTGILCCVGPTVLAIVGVVGAGTAYAWANTLYDGYAWLFRLAGLLVARLHQARQQVVLGGLVAWSLKRRNQCSLTGARRVWPKLTMSLGVAVLTYAALYALTTWLGTFA